MHVVHTEAGAPATLPFEVESYVGLRFRHRPAYKILDARIHMRILARTNAEH
jgi:hypothetical protein